MKFIASILLIILTGCNYPKDPENSFDEANNDSLKVGIVNNPPYVIIENGKVSGTEIEILKNFANSNELNISFKEGSESILVKKLKNYTIHIIAGGFDKKTIWKKYTGTSTTYDSEHLFLIPKGENKLLQRLETHIFQYKKK